MPTRNAATSVGDGRVRQVERVPRGAGHRSHRHQGALSPLTGAERRDGVAVEPADDQYPVGGGIGQPAQALLGRVNRIGGG